MTVRLIYRFHVELDDRCAVAFDRWWTSVEDSYAGRSVQERLLARPHSDQAMQLLVLAFQAGWQAGTID